MLLHYVAVFVIFVTIQLSFSFNSSELDRLIAECADKNHVEVDELDKVDWMKPEEIDEKYLCTMKCFFERNDVVKSDGTFDVDGYMQLLGELESSESESESESESTSKSSQEVMDCLNGVGKIETCGDLKKIVYCDPHFE